MSKKRKKKSSKNKPSSPGRLLQLKQADKLDGFKDFIEVGRGKGGFTIIYSALKSATERVALKLFVLKSGDATQQKLRYEKFKNEALILKKLESHDHIVLCHDDEAKTTGKHNGKSIKADYFTMELLRGSLTDHMEDLQATQTPWELKSKLEVLIQICKAIEHAHDKKIYHRDLYADNILLVDAAEPLHAKVSDFGAAKSTDIPSTTKYYQPLGARTISSPEMLVGLASEHETLVKSDIFSIGLLIHHVLMEAPHNLETFLLTVPIPPNDNRTKQQREDYLKNTVIPYLQTFTQQAIIIVEPMTNSALIEQRLNKLVSSATALDFGQRIAEVKQVREELEECRDLINA